MGAEGREVYAICNLAYGIVGGKERSGRLMHGLHRKPMTPDFLVEVTLVCLVCGGESTIHVFRNRCLPEKIFWECFDCQKGEGQSAGKIRKPEEE